MNIPNVYRKAVDGFIIPPRTFFQMFVSAAQGTFSLFEQENRSEFIANLDRGTINEGVISQATAGPMIMLSLFNDMQNPLFKRHQFDPTQFLDGVGGALANFHNVSGALENGLHHMADDSSGESSSTGEKKGDEANDKKAEDDEDPDPKEALAHILQAPAMLASEREGVANILNHDWMNDANDDSESLAGQLSKMVTKELFQIHQVSMKTNFMLQNPTQTNIRFKEGSCSVNNVALLSARAYLCREKENPDNNAGSGEEDDAESVSTIASGPQYELFEDIHNEGERIDESKLAVAAQVEVLYDVTQEFVQDKPLTAASTTEVQGEGSSSDSNNETVNNDGSDKTMQSTIVSVATLEGFLKGGPDGELRWKLALYRPAYEFPGIQQAY